MKVRLIPKDFFLYSWCILHNCQPIGKCNQMKWNEIWRSATKWKVTIQRFYCLKIQKLVWTKHGKVQVGFWFHQNWCIRVAYDIYRMLKKEVGFHIRFLTNFKTNGSIMNNLFLNPLSIMNKLFNNWHQLWCGMVNHIFLQAWKEKINKINYFMEDNHDRMVDAL